VIDGIEWVTINHQNPAVVEDRLQHGPDQMPIPRQSDGDVHLTKKGTREMVDRSRILVHGGGIAEPFPGPEAIPCPESIRRETRIVSWQELRSNPGHVGTEHLLEWRRVEAPLPDPDGKLAGNVDSQQIDRFIPIPAEDLQEITS
jgi:hypothetical protein